MAISYILAASFLIGYCLAEASIQTGTAGNAGSGAQFDANGYSAGRFVHKLSVCLEDKYDSIAMNGLALTFSDESQTTIGHMTSCKWTPAHTFGNDETVTWIDIYDGGAYGNTDGSSVSGFVMGTTYGKTLKFIEDQTYESTNKKVHWESSNKDQGNMLLGVYGLQTPWTVINKLGFTMLLPIVPDSLVLTNVSYDLSEVPPPQPKSIWDNEIPNPSATDSVYGAIKVEKSVTNTKQWNVGASLTLGMEFTIEAKVPLCVDEKTTAKWSLTASGSYQQTETVTTTESMNIPIMIPAKTKTRVIYVYFQGDLDAPFEGLIRVTVDNAEEWAYHVSGTYVGKDASRIIGDSTLMAVWNDDSAKWVYNSQ